MKSIAHVIVKDMISFLIMLSVLVLVASCKIAKDALAETLVESVQYPKTGAQVFSRRYDTEPYGVDVGKIVKARKAAKRERIQERLEKY